MNTHIFAHSVSNPLKIVSHLPSRDSDPTERKILSFLNPGRYTSAPAAVVFRALSVRLLAVDYGFAEIDASAGNDGEILVSTNYGSVCFEVTVEIDNTYTVSIEQNDNQVLFQDKLSFKQVEQRLREAAQRAWISSAGFVRTIGTPRSGAGKASLLSRPASTVVPA